MATHVHGQRHAVNVQGGDTDATYEDISDQYGAAVAADEADEDDAIVVYEISDRLVYDMETYGVDMCVLLPGVGFENRINQKIIDEHPGRFVAAAHPVQTKKRHLRGEEEWTWDAAIEELDEWLSKEPFKMVGEGIPTHPDRNPRPWPERREEVRRVFDVAAKNDAVIRWHTGTETAGYGTGGGYGLPDWKDPTLAGELKSEYPEVPIVFDHGGKNAGWREHTVDQCCQVAASWDDVYLEVGHYWADLLKKPYYDPNIGPEQMVWGCDWGASIVQHSQPGQDPPFYWQQLRDRGIPAHVEDDWGGSQRQMLKFALENDIEQDKLNLILGGNMVRLLDLEVPHTRLFEHYLQT